MIIDELFESPQQCPECGGISFSDLILAEKKDACYHKVKASAKVWPSAYASGRLVQCRKKGAANYGNKSEGVAEGWGGALAGAIGGGMIGGPVGAAVGGLGGYVLGGGNSNADLPDDPESAYELGQQAARDGKTEEDNPYEEGIFGPSDEMESWHDGWTDAQDNAEEQPQAPSTKQSSAPVAVTPKSFALTKISGPADFSKLGFTSYKKESQNQSMAEGEQQKGADYRDPKEVDYDGEYDAMVARVKKLAGLGPMKTVYDPTKRVYRNMPTAQQPKK